MLKFLSACLIFCISLSLIQASAVDSMQVYVAAGTMTAYLDWPATSVPAVAGEAKAPAVATSVPAEAKHRMMCSRRCIGCVAKKEAAVERLKEEAKAEEKAVAKAVAAFDVALQRRRADAKAEEAAAEALMEEAKAEEAAAEAPRSNEFCACSWCRAEAMAEALKEEAKAEGQAVACCCQHLPVASMTAYVEFQHPNDAGLYVDCAQRPAVPRPAPSTWWRAEAEAEDDEAVVWYEAEVSEAEVVEK